MAKNRTEKVLLNSAVTLTCQLSYLVASFVCRTIFAKMLGAEYLGINGLFSNILTILSFAELGIGSALVYRMYAPLAAKDQDKVCQYLLLYRKVYRCIILVIGVIGVALVPAIPYLVTAPDVKESVVLLYGLYLCQTLVTYVLVYKKSLLIADQKSYIVNVYTQVFNIGMNIAQCAFLVLTHNFVWYCVLNILFNLANNIACSCRANKEYPYIRHAPKGSLSPAEIKSLFLDVKGLLLTKIASTAFSGTDNIFISVFLGVKYVGILSNYTMICSLINGIMNQIFGSITASIGNLAATGEKAKAEPVLRKLFFLNTSLYGYICVGMLILLREFVSEIWLGPAYDMAQPIVFLVLLELFLRSIHYPLYTTRTALGCFSEYKGLFAVAALLNIILDFLLVRPFGISGLYIATIFSRSITYVVDIWVVYRMQFHRSVAEYMLIVGKWLLFLGICTGVSSFAVSWVQGAGVLMFLLKCGIVTIVYIGMFLVAFGRSEEFGYYVNLARRLLARK